MDSVVYVNSKQQLKDAIESGADTIHILNSEVAKNIKVVKGASKAALVAGIASAGIAATNFWNPIGWGAAIASAAISSTIIIAILFLGSAVLIWAIYNDYKIIGKRTVTRSDGTVEEVEVTLEKKAA